MAYGRGQTIGSGINPALSRADYSPIERGGAAYGQAFQKVGGDIGDAIKVNKEMDRRAKSGAQIAQSIVDNFGADSNLGKNATQMLELFNSPDATMRDKVAAADAIGQAFQIGTEALNQQHKQDMLAAQSARNPRGFSASSPFTIQSGDKKETFMNVTFPDGNQVPMPVSEAIPLLRESMGMGSMQQGAPAGPLPVPDISGEPSAMAGVSNPEIVPGTIPDAPALPVAGDPSMPAGSVLPNRDGSFDPLVEEQPPAPADAGVEAPVGSEFGVFDVGQDSDTSWQRFVVDDKVMAFNPKTRQVEPVLDESGNPVKATEKDKKMSNLQERAEMLRQSIRLKTGRKELSDAEEAAVLQEVVRFNALEAMMRKTMGGIGEDDL